MGWRTLINHNGNTIVGGPAYHICVLTMGVHDLWDNAPVGPWVPVASTKSEWPALDLSWNCESFRDSLNNTFACSPQPHVLCCLAFLFGMHWGHFTSWNWMLSWHNMRADFYSLSLLLAYSICLSLSHCLCICLSLSLTCSVSASICLSLSLTHPLCICVCVCLSLWALSLSLTCSVSASVCLSFFLCLSPLPPRSLPIDCIGSQQGRITHSRFFYTGFKAHATKSSKKLNQSPGHNRQQHNYDNHLQSISSQKQSILCFKLIKVDTFTFRLQLTQWTMLEPPNNYMYYIDTWRQENDEITVTSDCYNSHHTVVTMSRVT